MSRVRKLEERMCLEKLSEEQLSDSRQRTNKQFTLGPALVSNALYPGQERNTMCKLEVQIANSGLVDVDEETEAFTIGPKFLSLG
jgi:hypothetical protein